MNERTGPGVAELVPTWWRGRAVLRLYEATVVLDSGERRVLAVTLTYPEAAHRRVARTGPRAMDEALAAAAAELGAAPEMLRLDSLVWQRESLVRFRNGSRRRIGAAA